MTRITATQARALFSEIVNRAAFGGERIVIHRQNHDVAAVISLEDLALLEALENHIDVLEAKAALRESKEEGTTAWDDFKAELGL